LIGADPVALGLVGSFNRPAGNVTGVSFLTSDLNAKRLGLISELASAASTVALLLNPTNPDAKSQEQNMQTAARALERRLVIVQASTETEFESVFAMLKSEQTGALVIENDAFFDS
jgi:putative ABC transport system substrate-binding protein